MRRIEVRRLTPESFQGNTVHVQGKGPKGGKWRTVRYHPDTKEIIGSWLLERKRMIRKAEEKNPNIEVPEKLLIWQRGSQLSGYSNSGIDGILIRLRERLETLYDRAFEFSNHTLRRTGGRMMWKAGVPLETIASILGHENPKQTVEYLGINLDDQAEAMEMYAQYQDSLISPKKGIFETEPVVGVGPKRFFGEPKSGHWLGFGEYPKPVRKLSSVGTKSDAVRSNRLH